MPTVTSHKKGISTDQVLQYLRAYLVRYDRMPTKREIATKFGFSSTNASGHHLNRLVDQGVLEKWKTGWRFRRDKS